MDQKQNRRKSTIELRYYELPEHEPVLVLQGEEWARVYSDGTRTLHFHNLMEIGVCHWGEGVMGLDNDEDIPYTGGMVTFIPANCLHTTISKDASMNDWAYLFLDPSLIMHRAFPDDALFAESIVRRLEREARFLSAAESEKMRQLIEMVLAEYRERSLYHGELVQRLLTALLLYAAQFDTGSALPAVQPMSVGLRQIMPAMEYINRNYMNSVSVAELAAQCSLSEAQLRRKFKEYLNMSPGDQLTLVRVRRGCELLNTTDFTVPEVAMRVGYQSVSSFSRNFSKLVGTTPYHYKRHSEDYRGKVLRYRISAKRGWETREDE